MNDGNACQGERSNFNSNPVIPGLDPGISFQELNGRHPDFRMKSSRKPPPGDTRIKSGYDGRGAVFNIDEKSRIADDDAVQLGQYFDTTAEFWMNMQRDYDQIDRF